MRAAFGERRFRKVRCRTGRIVASLSGGDRNLQKIPRLGKEEKPSGMEGLGWEELSVLLLLL
jgi:hypothetical protein